MRRLCIAIIVALGISVAAPAIAYAQQGAGYQIQTEEEQGGRSGFWTNRAPAKGGAYRWRLLGVGVGLLAITGTGMLLLIRRAKNDRDKNDRDKNDRDKNDRDKK